MIAMGIHCSCHDQVPVGRTAPALITRAATPPVLPISAWKPWYRVAQRTETSSYCSHTFQEKKKVCFSKQTWWVKSRNRLWENEREHTRCGRLKVCKERVKRKKKSHCKEEKSFLYLERETLRYPCDISFRSSYTAEASKTSLPFHFLANYICVLDWM